MTMVDRSMRIGPKYADALGSGSSLRRILLYKAGHADTGIFARS